MCFHTGPDTNSNKGAAGTLEGTEEVKYRVTGKK